MAAVAAMVSPVTAVVAMAAVVTAVVWATAEAVMVAVMHRPVVMAEVHTADPTLVTAADLTAVPIWAMAADTEADPTAALTRVMAAAADHTVAVMALRPLVIAVDLTAADPMEQWAAMVADIILPRAVVTVADMEADLMAVPIRAMAADHMARRP